MENLAFDDGIFLMPDGNSNERSVLIFGNAWASAFSDKPERTGKRLTETTRRLQNGLHRTIVLRTEVSTGGDSATVNAAFWSFDSPVRADDSAYRVKSPKVLYDEEGRLFRVLPYRGERANVAVLIEPELIVLCPVDLDPDLPPAVERGRCREMIKLFKQILAIGPKMVVPRSGIPLRGETAVRALQCAIAYLEALNTQVESRISDHYPPERLVYSIEWTQCMTSADINASPELLERHRSNVFNVAQDYRSFGRQA